MKIKRKKSPTVIYIFNSTQKLVICLGAQLRTSDEQIENPNRSKQIKLKIFLIDASSVQIMIKCSNETSNGGQPRDFWISFEMSARKVLQIRN